MGLRQCTTKPATDRGEPWVERVSTDAYCEVFPRAIARFARHCMDGSGRGDGISRIDETGVGPDTMVAPRIVRRRLLVMPSAVRWRISPEPSRRRLRVWLDDLRDDPLADEPELLVRRESASEEEAGN
jgi:hypothetical protein